MAPEGGAHLARANVNGALRIRHRGRANNSDRKRPIMYIGVVSDWCAPVHDANIPWSKRTA